MEEKEINRKYSLRTHDRVNVRPSVKSAVEKGISTVWNKLVGKPSTFNVVHTGRLTNPKTGRVLKKRSAEYDSETDTFVLAHETMKETNKAGLSNADYAFILSAHESTHKAQHHRGDTAPPSPKTDDEQNPRFDNRHEDEAWRESLDAFKKHRPGVSGYVQIGKKRYRIPRESNY